jgi:hypothetical protein
MDAPLLSPENMAALKKVNPTDATAIQSAISSGKLPPNLTAAQAEADIAKLPPAMRTQLVADLKAAGITVSMPTNTAAPPKRNPFTPTYSIAQLESNVPPVTSFVSFENLSHLKPKTTYSPVVQVGGGAAPVDVALGRVSGIIISGGIHAIYEADGTSTILQPGDALPDGAGRVVAIYPTSIVVRIPGNRYVRVEVSAGQNQAEQANQGNQFNPGIGFGAQGIDNSP